MSRSTYLVMAMAALPGVMACGDDDDGPADPGTSFTANLSGSEEVPPVPSTATGSADLTIGDGQITYTITMMTAIQNAVASHIHVAPDGENGPVRMNLCGTGDPVPACVSGTGVLASGTNSETEDITFDELVAAIQAGNAYVNVHTDNGTPPPNTGPGDMASGEIRGQIVPD